MQQREQRFMRQRSPGSRGSLPHHRSAPLRGNARQKYESYLAKAREAQVAGETADNEAWGRRASGEKPRARKLADALRGKAIARKPALDHRAPHSLNGIGSV
jgi:hypothetical protein